MMEWKNANFVIGNPMETLVQRDQNRHKSVDSIHIKGEIDPNILKMFDGDWNNGMVNQCNEDIEDETPCNPSKQDTNFQRYSHGLLGPEWN